MQSMDCAPFPGCISLCVALVKLLSASKHNKRECASLAAVVRCIQLFVEELAGSAHGLSAAGFAALGHVQGVLESSQAFLARVASTGPLWSLLNAASLRDDFVRIHRDLSSAFTIMGAGESLVRTSDQQRRALRAVEDQLANSRTLFADQELVAMKLSNIVEVDQRQHLHPEKLHSLLLQELQPLEEVTALSPEELLAELQALQLAAERGWDLGDTPVKDKCLGAHTEELLVQHLCAALTPKAAQANRPLSPECALQVPEDYLCPISHSVMVQPVMLVETGHSFEAANIQRWLELHDTCPLTQAQLVSKQLTVNYALRSAIQRWAAGAGVRLPDAPAFSPLVGSESGAGGSVGTGAGVNAASARHSSSSSWSAGARGKGGEQLQGGPGQLVPPMPNTAAGSRSSMQPGLGYTAGATTGSASSAGVSSAGRSAAAGLSKGFGFRSEDDVTSYHDRVGAANKGLPLGHACSSNTSFFLGKGPEGRLHTRWRCTRTSWAVALILAVVVVSAVVGTGVAVGKGHAAAAGDQRATRSAEANALGGTNVSGVANGTASQSHGQKPSTTAVPPPPSPKIEIEAHVKTGKWLAVSAGQSHTCGISLQGGRLRCWGANSQKQTTVPADVSGSPWDHVSAGALHTCAILSTGKLRCWGQDIHKECTIPAPHDSATWAAVAAGSRFTCGILVGGPSLFQNRMVCWGDSTASELDSVSSHVMNWRWTHVSAGWSHACGIITKYPEMYCWGSALYNQSTVPDRQANPQWGAVSAGMYHTCGILKASSKLVCWGLNDHKQTTVPASVVGAEWVAVSAGGAHTCGIIASSGKLVCWGLSSHGQCNVPYRVRAWKAVSAGDTHTCGLASDTDELLCWGNNGDGQADVPKV